MKVVPEDVSTAPLVGLGMPLQSTAVPYIRIINHNFFSSTNDCKQVEMYSIH